MKNGNLKYQVVNESLEIEFKLENLIERMLAAHMVQNLRVPLKKVSGENKARAVFGLDQKILEQLNVTKGKTNAKTKQRRSNRSKSDSNAKTNQ